MALNKWIALVATEDDLTMLNAIAKQDGDAGKSATVRRLIREEARRRQIEVTEPQRGELIPELA